MKKLELYIDKKDAEQFLQTFKLAMKSVNDEHSQYILGQFLLQSATKFPNNEVSI